MSKVTTVLALGTGCAIGFMAMALLYANAMWRTCSNRDAGGGFECSHCGSHTEYGGWRKFRYCPICGAFIMEAEEI